MDASAGMSLHAMTMQENQMTFALLRPYLVSSGLIIAELFDEQYR
jgi:hypothetical protein